MKHALGRIQKNAATIYGYEKMKSDNENGESHDLSAMHPASLGADNEFRENLRLLEQQLSKYIQFTNIKGWKFIG